MYTQDASAQFTIQKNTVAELKLTDSDHSERLFCHLVKMSFIRSVGEFKCVLNMDGLSPEQQYLKDDRFITDFFDPSDTSFIIFKATVSADIFKPSHGPTDNITFQIPGYISYKGIDQAIIADCSYGGSMNQDVNLIYLNLFFRFQNQEVNRIYFPFIGFVATEVQVEINDGLVNQVNQ